MSDYSELKLLAEASRAANHDELGPDEAFQEALHPEVVMALIAELERYRQYGCGTCDGSGHLHRADGEYCGACTSCGAYDLEQAKRERDQLKAENERLRQGVAGDFDLDAWIEWAKEAAKLRAENEALRKGIDPTWSLMDQSLLIDHLRLNTNFAADKFDAMIQFAVECAQYVELHPSQGDKSGG